MMRLTLVRHGETEHNRGGLTLGRHDVALNDLGRQQAAALAASFSKRPAAVYSSPLIRARDTAAAIAAAAGVPVIVEPGLIEMDVGEMEHLTRDELRARYPDFVRQWFADAADARMPGGETLREVQDRAWHAVERIRTAHADADVVAVTHNFVILATISRALGIPLSGFRRIRTDLASRSTLEFADAAATLVQLNDRAHLVAAGLADT
jgi:broad specificity phosphatase PhoE